MKNSARRNILRSVRESEKSKKSVRQRPETTGGFAVIGVDATDDSEKSTTSGASSMGGVSRNFTSTDLRSCFVCGQYASIHPLE